MDAVERRHPLLLEVPGHRLVGQQHELFDEPVRDVPFGGDDGGNRSGVVDHHFGLGQIEVDRAAPAPPLVQHGEQLGHQLEHRHELGVLRQQRRVAVSEDAVDRGIGHAGAAVDDAVVQFIAHDLTAVIDLHQARLHQPVDMRVQAAHPGREFVREHVHGPFGEVDRGAPFEAVEVERAALRHVVGDVGDVDAQPEVAVGQALDRDGVVEVAGVLAVDGHDGAGAEVGAPDQVVRMDGDVTGPGLGDRVGRMVVGDAVLAQHHFGVDARVVERAQHFDDAAGGLGGHARPARDLDGHHIAVLGAQVSVDGDADVGIEPGVERADHRETLAIAAHLPDHSRAAALDHLEHAPLGAAIVLAQFDAGHHEIAVQGASAAMGRNEDVLAAPRCDDEREAARVTLQAAGHVVHALRQGVAIAAHHDQRPGGGQRLQLTFERGLGLARDGQGARQIAGGGGRAGMGANGLEQGVLVGHGMAAAGTNEC